MQRKGWLLERFAAKAVDIAQDFALLKPGALVPPVLVVQIDHTKAGVFVVDEETWQPNRSGRD